MGGRPCERALKKLYDTLRPKVIHYVKQNNGSIPEAKDVLQDAIVAVYSSIINKKFRSESALSTYTFAVVKNQWLNRLKRKRVEIKYIETQDDSIFESDMLPAYLDAERKNIIEQIFMKMGEGCKEILVKIYYLNYSMKEIVTESNYENEQVARNKKYKCMKRLKKVIQGNESVCRWLRDQAI